MRLREAEGKLHLGIDGLWYNSIFIRDGLEEKNASEWDWVTWRSALPLEVRRRREATNIWAEDVTSLFKFLQVDPGTVGMWPDYKCEPRKENHGIPTVSHCRGLGQLREAQ